jgi:2-oxoglutarate ferredoxin oxidoreductase subunit gamma
MGRIEILLSGLGGQGIILAGYVIAGAAAIYDKRESVFIPSYGPEARGGTCRSAIVIDEKEIGYPYVTAPDIFVAMSQEAYEKYISKLKKGGILVYDEDLVEIDERAEGVRTYGIPATKLAEQQLGHRIVANAIMLGFLTSITEVVSCEGVKRSITDRLAKKFIQLNLRAFDMGYRLGKEVISE